MRVLLFWLFIFLLVVVGVLLVISTQASPKYDLIFSVDFNEVPYSNPKSTGVVIRVRHCKADVIITGKTQQYLEDDKPDVYVCEVASGKLRKIRIPIQVPGYALLPGDVEYWKYWGRPAVPIYVPGLESVTIDNSNTAPNGYTLSGLTFDKTYQVLDVVLPFPYISFPFGKALKEDVYKKCLEQVASHQSGLTVHFIGWVIP
jgi:hypothetical protein